MQPLDVTEDQYVFIQQLRDAIAEHVVGKYGHVRERDAVQFMIDNLDDDFELPDDFEVDESIEVSLPAIEETASAAEGPADETVAVSFDESNADEEADADETAGDEEAETTEPDVETDEEADTGEADEADADERTEDGSADDDDMLNEMMSLLDTHDDKWDEADAADYRYSVDLPDGTVENVQTKDDVRALLFKHYR